MNPLQYTLSAAALTAFTSVSASAQAGLPTDQAVQAWSQLSGTWSGSWSPRFDASTGTFREALGRVRVAPGGLDGDQGRALALEILTVLEPLLGTPAADLQLAYEARPGQRHVLQYEQYLDGRVVEGSRVELTLGTDGYLLCVRSHGVLRPGQQTVPAVDRSAAGDLARQAMGSASSHALAWNPRLVWTAADGPGRPRGRLAWRVDVVDPRRTDGAASVLLDASTGAVLQVRAEVTEAVTGTVKGRAVAAGPQGGALATLPMANLYVAGSDADKFLIRLTDDGLEQSGAVISAGGGVVVYEQLLPAGRQLFAQPSSGGLAVQLTTVGDNYDAVLNAAGTQLWFTSTSTGNEDVWTVMSDGSGLAQLTADPADESGVDLAEAAGRVFWQSERGGDWEIYSANLAGGAVVKITSNGDYDGELSVSDDGLTLAIISDRDGPRDVYVLSDSGFGWSALRVTFGARDERVPVLTPDGMRIVFESDVREARNGGSIGAGSSLGAPGGSFFGRLRTPPSAIFESSSDGTFLRRMTHGESHAVQPFTPAVASTWAERAYSGAPRIAMYQDDATGIRIPLSAGPGDADGPHVAASASKGVFTWEVDGDREVFVFDLMIPGAVAATVTDDVGAYSLDLPDGGSPTVSTALSGLFVRVIDLAPGQAELRESTTTTAPMAAVDLLFNEMGALELPSAQTTAYFHTDGAHGLLADVFTGPAFGLPTPLPIDFPIEARVNDPTGQANAFYNLVRKDMTFFVTGAAINGAYDSVVAHEYGHAADDAFGGIVSGSVRETRFTLSEALGDVLALSYTGIPIVGMDFFGAGAHIRDYGTEIGASAAGASNRQWDCSECPGGFDGLPESHAHGEAFAGFGVDLRLLVGDGTADELLFGTFVDNPADSPDAVISIFMASAGGAFGGSGDPATSPLYDSICEAAAKHGFPCWPRPDFGGELCVNGACPAFPALHAAVKTEWLGATVDGLDPGCVLPAADEDGVTVDVFWMSGEVISIDVDFAVDTALQASGRYHATNPLRKAYLNMWLYLPGPAGVEIIHMIGTGSPTGTVAYDPSGWPGGMHSETFLVTAPVVPDDRVAFLRFRFDFGEDSGVLFPMNKLSSPLLTGPCGPALFGEVEDYQIYITAP